MTPVRHEPAALRSRVKHSTTEPLRSQYSVDMGLFSNSGPSGIMGFGCTSYQLSFTDSIRILVKSSSCVSFY